MTTHSLARRTLTTTVSLALCTGLLGLVLGFGVGVWWARRERAWYVEVLIYQEGEHAPCNMPGTPPQLAPPRTPF